MTTSTTDLAARARDIAHTAPAASLERRAAGCAAVVLRDARTPEGAVRMLQAADLDPDVARAAEQLIHQLTQEEPQP